MNDYISVPNSEPHVRTGLRICGSRGNPFVKSHLISFVKWVRTQYEFPIRCPVYLSPRHYIITIHGVKASASFFAPWNPTVEPYIRIATGDFYILKEKWGFHTALDSYIISLCHEIVHYRQWVETQDAWEKCVIGKAMSILRKYERER
jgi:hypothetical protein